MSLDSHQPKGLLIDAYSMSQLANSTSRKLETCAEAKGLTSEMIKSFEHKEHDRY
jgi:hypothetical protein